MKKVEFTENVGSDKGTDKSQHTPSFSKKLETFTAEHEKTIKILASMDKNQLQEYLNEIKPELRGSIEQLIKSERDRNMKDASATDDKSKMIHEMLGDDFSSSDQDKKLIKTFEQIITPALRE